MDYALKRTVILPLIFVSQSLLGQSKLAGFYASTPKSGFFITRIQLNEDFTFKYEFDGDASYHNAKGTYRVDDKNFVQFIFDSNKLDSAARTAKVLFGNFSRPKKMFYKDTKLFFIDAEEKVMEEFYLNRIKGKRLLFRGEKE